MAGRRLSPPPPEVAPRNQLGIDHWSRWLSPRPGPLGEVLHVGRKIQVEVEGNPEDVRVAVQGKQLPPWEMPSPARNDGCPMGTQSHGT